MLCSSHIIHTCRATVSCRMTILLASPSKYELFIAKANRRQNSLRGPPPSSPSSPRKTTWNKHVQFIMQMWNNYIQRVQLLPPCKSKIICTLMYLVQWKSWLSTARKASARTCSRLTSMRNWSHSSTLLEIVWRTSFSVLKANIYTISIWSSTQMLGGWITFTKGKFHSVTMFSAIDWPWNSLLYLPSRQTVKINNMKYLQHLITIVKIKCLGNKKIYYNWQ